MKVNNNIFDAIVDNLNICVLSDHENLKDVFNIKDKVCKECSNQGICQLLIDYKMEIKYSTNGKNKYKIIKTALKK